MNFPIRFKGIYIAQYYFDNARPRIAVALGGVLNSNSTLPWANRSMGDLKMKNRAHCHKSFDLATLCELAARGPEKQKARLQINVIGLLYVSGTEIGI